MHCLHMHRLFCSCRTASPVPPACHADVDVPPVPHCRTSVTKTLAEFRRTHEEAGLSEARELLTAEQWEAIRDVASPASYFV
jgi:hypothetical protein